MVRKACPCNPRSKASEKQHYRVKEGTEKGSIKLF